jgi:hypothetical protein
MMWLLKLYFYCQGKGHTSTTCPEKLGDQRQDRRALLGNKIPVRPLPKAPAKQWKIEDDEQVLLTKESFKEHFKKNLEGICQFKKDEHKGILGDCLDEAGF